MFLLDANVFIEAKNRYYAFQICPGFWDWMDKVAAPDAEVRSITKVWDELAGGKDSLADWVKSRKSDGRFLDVTDVATQTAFGQVAAHVQSGIWTAQAKAHFLAGADPWLVAKARALQATVVTLEKPRPAAKAKVFLPDICQAFSVRFIDTFDLLDTHAAAFSLIVT